MVKRVPARRDGRRHKPADEVLHPNQPPVQAAWTWPVLAPPRGDRGCWDER